MFFQSLYEKLPKIAEEETRSIILFEDNEYGLPADEYMFIEMYCGTKKCDCRRAMFTVISAKNQQTEAIINWGWETRDFYKKWIGMYDKELITEMIGPSLNMSGEQSDNAPKVLQLFIDVLMKDIDYCNRVKRHYQTFKKTK